jgi:hypothetical protein
MAALKHKPHFFGIFYNMHFLPSWKLFPLGFQERRKSKLYYNGLGTAFSK